MEQRITCKTETNVWIIGIRIKYPTTVQQVMKYVSSQQITGKCNKFHVITDRIDKSISI